MVGRWEKIDNKEKFEKNFCIWCFSYDCKVKMYGMELKRSLLLFFDLFF